MKTGITVTKCHQVGVESWADEKTTKIFDDNSTIGDIKAWIKSELCCKSEIKDIGLSGNIISDIKE